MKEFTQHTYSICAYKESKYLEECVLSIINQSMKSNILMVTSTPNKYIKDICEKYKIDLFIRKGKADIQEDWNFAYSMAKTDYVTIAHQDDIYKEGYTENIYRSVKDNKKQVIFFTKYMELKNGEVIPNIINLKIKNFMLAPLKLDFSRDKKIIRKMILSLGSPICCPSVTYNKKNNEETIFNSKMKCSLDWDTWYKLSEKDGQFVYINKVLMLHRIHEESETTNSIENNVRQSEDYEMFQKFWPKPIAKFLNKVYSRSLNTNKV